MSEEFDYLNTIDHEPAEDEIVGFRLENGFTVLMCKNHETPAVAVDLWYKVGSRDEQPGKSGFAHLFEHMMFEGSENVKKSEHIKIISDVGGIVNGSTSPDRTNYWEVVPSNQLELVFWLEADRMRSLDLSEKNFENQRSTVKEERRLRVDNQPYMRVLYELKDEVAYQNFAYRHSVIGSMEDLDNATLEDVRQFHQIYYRPNNAVMAIVGDFQVQPTLNLVRKYFETIPAGPPVPPVDLSEPPQQKERRVQYPDPFAPFPAYLFAYHIPERTHPDYYPLHLLEKILFDGESSRLYRKLIEEKPVALHLFGGWDGKFGPGLLYGFAQVHPASSIQELEETVRQEFEQIQKYPVSQRELEKAKNKVKADFVLKKETYHTRAEQLCLYATIFNNPDMMEIELNRFLNVTIDDLLAVSQKYFSRENRSVIEIYPGQTRPEFNEPDGNK
ncbi:MAG: pitrilysin family protein [Calditrichia bacterium]